MSVDDEQFESIEDRFLLYKQQCRARNEPSMLWGDWVRAGMPLGGEVEA